MNFLSKVNFSVRAKVAEDFYITKIRVLLNLGMMCFQTRTGIKE
jgi:hypothetical protein